MTRLGLLLLFFTFLQLCIGFRVSPVKAQKRNEVIKKVRPVSKKGSEMKTLQMSRQTGSSEEKSTTSSALEAFQMTSYGPPTQEATTRYRETNKVNPISRVMSKSMKVNNSKINKKFSKTPTSQSSRTKAKSSQKGNKISWSQGGKLNVVVSTKEDTQRISKKKVQPVPEKSQGMKTFEMSTQTGGSSEKTTQEVATKDLEKKNIDKHKEAIPRSGKINVVVSAKEDTQRIIRMVKNQIKRLIKREIKKIVEKDIMPFFVQKRFPIPFMSGMGLFLKQKVIHRMLKQYTARMNIYARLLR